MSDNKITGTREGMAFFRSALAELGETQSSMARLMKEYGDDRLPDTIPRNLQRMASDDQSTSSAVLPPR